MDHRSGLRAVLRYVTQLHDNAAARLESARSRLKASMENESIRQHNRRGREKAVARSEAAVRKYKDWQESLIKAIDGE